MARLSRPLNRQAVNEADNRLYEKYANDPRPNSLFDANGNRRALDPNDPNQVELRREWVALYTENVAADTYGSPPPSAASDERRVADPVQPCPNKHWIRVCVMPRPDSRPRPIYWASLASNPYASEVFAAQLTDGQRSGSLDGSGSVHFDGIPAGSCQLKMEKFFKAITDYFDTELAAFISR
jgi:hypothetical protein